MVKLLVVMSIVATVAPGLAAEGVRSRDAEAPRATDLLRAERMAEEARRRLSLPRRKTARWARGGSGWGGSSERAEEKRPIVVNVRQPRKRKAR